ncbi:MAG TPA: ethylbenzene dehydrogenase-related protein, partial [Chloroflexia bacterium]|nr:ethylbenzene dehydrogenase-related protein [Chloroflexia bacterium]
DSGRLFRKVNIGAGLTARGKAICALTALMLVGVGLSMFIVPLASSAANSIDVIHINQQVPTDPRATEWDSTKDAEIPLSAQQIYQPGGGTTRMVRVRALEDGQSIAFRVSWDDATRNNEVGNIASDAVAIQLPIDPSRVPYQCMGQSTSRVNIWQWKAAFEQMGSEAVGATAFEGAGVRNLTSNGICKAVDTPGVLPRAVSYHDGKQWQVVFYRALARAEPGTAPLVRGASTSIAFAVWNGARGEVRGMKAVSTWNTLVFPQVQPDSAGGLITLGIIVLASAGAVAYTMRRFAS